MDRALNCSGERFQNNVVSVTGFIGSVPGKRPIRLKRYAVSKISGFVWT